jgi:hypothetical protein
MATFNIAFHTRLNGVAVLQTFVDADIQTQDTITVAGCGHGFNGSHLVISSEPYEYLGQSDEGDLLFDYNVIRENQVIFFDEGDNEERSIADGTISFTPSCTWITKQNVLDWLGISPATANDDTFVTACTEAANALAYRRRRSSGYTDSLTTVPSADVKLGCQMYAGGLYRARGTSGYDGFAAFESMSTGGPAVAMGEILRLWGCNRAQVA